MSSSGLIYAVIVGGWAAFLVPRWLRRQDEMAEARSARRFSDAVRVLRRRGATGYVMRPRPAVPRTAVVKSSHAHGVRPASSAVSSAAPTFAAHHSPFRDTHPARRPRSGDHGISLSSPQAATGGAGRTATLARRRRVLGLLVSLTVVGAAAAGIGVIGWPVALVPAVLLLGYVHQLRRLAAAATDLRPATRTVGPVPVVPSRRRTAIRRPTTKAGVHAAPVPAEDPDGWQPVPVPVPTYVNAPRAEREVRRIDLSSDDAWTSGHLTQDERVAAGVAELQAEAARMRKERLRRRAVND